VDVAKISAVDGELDNFISRRHEKRVEQEGERLAEEMWAESERRYAARQREVNRAAWCKYHQDQAARHRAILETLATYHEGEVAKLQLEDAVVEGEGG
jgi:selenocysteine-specific translation elongation factor